MEPQNEMRRRNNIRKQRQLNRLQNENNDINISSFFENENIREQRQLNKLQNENNIDIRKNGYCQICNTNIHRASIAKHLRSKKKHLENEMIIPNTFFNENLLNLAKLPNKTVNKLYNPLKISEISQR